MIKDRQGAKPHFQGGKRDTDAGQLLAFSEGAKMALPVRSGGGRASTASCFYPCRVL